MTSYFETVSIFRFQQKTCTARRYLKQRWQPLLGKY